MHWETTRDDSLISRHNGTGGHIHTVSNLSHLESRLLALENVMKGLVLHQSPPSQTLEMCSQCHTMDHTLSTCPYFAHHLASSQEQVNMIYQRPKNNPYTPTFNPGKRNHPSFSWTSVPNAIVLNQYGGFPQLLPN